MERSSITADFVRELLLYDGNTGVLTWRVSTARTIKIGDIAGSRKNDGRRQVKIRYRLYWVHRLVWLYVYGQWPPNQIDHINGDPSDNRIENLRSGSYLLNAQNRRGPGKRSKSGLLGVHKNEIGSYVAQIKNRGTKIYLGTFSTPEEASSAYVAAKRKLHEGCTI